MPATPTYGLRYPTLSDPANGPAGFQNLATDVESALNGKQATVADTGWVTSGITYLSGFSSNASYPIQVRKIGTTVYIRGAVTNTTGAIYGSYFITLPSAYRPSRALFIGPTIASNAFYGQLLLDTSGRITVPSGYGAGGMASGTVIPVVAVWQTD